MTEDIDARVRARAFQFLDELAHRYGDALPRTRLVEGIEFEGRRVPLMGPQGIFKPAVLPNMPLSVTTAPIVEGRPRPYDDQVTSEGLIAYRYRGDDPNHHENVGLRLAMQSRTPIIYFEGVARGLYFASRPTFVVGDDPGRLTFALAIDDPVVGAIDQPVVAENALAARRAYITRAVRQRMHQVGFRERVLKAYTQSCAVCRLRHRELLDAAHIVPDSHPMGEPWVSNGLALCKIHHAAFDANILGVTPRLVVEVRQDILREIDGPMLRHGIQELHGKPLVAIPRNTQDRPKEGLLAIRYEEFRRAG
ncbi:MAG: HNH endonuclease [Candidatus Eiseniibacteriota bacterium]